jgi:hypothetical protein
MEGTISSNLLFNRFENVIYSGLGYIKAEESREKEKEHRRLL